LATLQWLYRGSWGTIFKNTVVLTIAKIYSQLILLLVASLISRTLGVAAFGVYSLALAWTAIIFRVTDLGIPIILRRDVAQNFERSYKYLGNTLTIRLATSIIALILILILSRLAGYEFDTVVIILGIAAVNLFESFSELMLSLSHAHQKMEHEGLAIGIRTTLLLLLILLWFNFHATLNLLVLCLIAAAGMKYFFAVYLCEQNFVTPKLQFDRLFVTKLLRQSIPLGFAGIFVIIFFRVDTVMLSILKDDESVGIYNAAYAFMAGAPLLSSAFLTSLFPYIAQSTTDIKKIRKTFFVSTGLMGITGSCIAIVLALYSSSIIALLFGAELVGKSDSVLQILAIAILFLFLSTTCGVFLNATGYQVINMWATCIVAVFNVLVNLYMIPAWGPNGAAWSTLLSYLLAFTLMGGYFVARVLNTDIESKALSFS